MWVALERVEGRRASWFGALGLALALALSMVPTQAAVAGEHDVEVSGDGVNYTTASSLALFQNIALTVPGDTQTESFWIRNSASSAGYLRVMVTDVVTTNPALASALIIEARTALTTGESAPLSKVEQCWIMVEGDLVNPGDAVRVTATLSLGDLDGTLGQNGRASFSVRASVSDAEVGSLPPTSCGGAAEVDPVSGPPAVIAMTGSDLPYPLLVTGAGALGVGLFLLMAARRRRQEDA